MTDEGGLIPVSALASLISRLTIDQESLQREFDQARRETEQELKEKELAIREIET